MQVRWLDWIAAAGGGWLVVSPDVLGYTLDRAAAENAYGVGLVVLLFNVISACRLIDQGQEIFNVLLGAWLALSPFSLGFRGEWPAAGNTIAVGAVVVLCAGWSLANPPRSEKS